MKKSRWNSGSTQDRPIRIGADILASDDPKRLALKRDTQLRVDPVFLADRLAEIANRGPTARGKRFLLFRRERIEVCAELFHDLYCTHG
jgi:hypothetical protein